MNQTPAKGEKISDVEYADDNVADKIFNTRLRLLFLFITIFIQIWFFEKITIFIKNLKK